MGDRHGRDLGAVALRQHGHSHGAARNRGEETRFPVHARGPAQDNGAEPAYHEDRDGRRHDGAEIGSQLRYHRGREVQRHRRTQDHLSHLAAIGDRAHA